MTTKRAVIAAISIAVLTQLNMSELLTLNQMRVSREWAEARLPGTTIVSKTLDMGIVR
jgi:hypothetical protein